MNKHIKWSIFLNKFSTLKPYADNEFNEAIFHQCINQVDCDYFYPLISIEHFVQQFQKASKSINKNIVIIGTSDLFNMVNGIEEDSDTKITYIERIIQDVVDKHPFKKFIIFHENIIDPIIGSIYDNIIWIHWSNITCERNKYITLDPIINKNYTSNKPVVALNNQIRCHRIALISYLYGTNLNEKCVITALKLHEKCDIYNNPLDLIPWDLSEEVVRYLKKGYKCACNEHINDYVKYNSTYINNYENFKKLYKLYTNSFVEIISETSYTSYGIMAEKYLHSVYACNFPILIASYGSVKYLRELGFDMFDDIVNHSYDNIESPCLRMETAIQQNIHLFDKNVINEWHTVKDRFLNNVSFAKDKMYKVFEDRIYNEFKKAI